MAKSADDRTAPLGEWIRAVRADQGVSQRALAERSGLSRSYLCDIERGRGSHPSVETLDKLAKALGSSRVDLLRVAGILEAPGRAADERERRFLALYRDLGERARETVEQFARFVHAEEHRWMQPRLLDEQDGDSPNGDALAAGPTLFDGLAGSGKDRR